MKTVPVETTTVNLATGEEKTATTLFHLMPPHPDACQTCGMHPAHPPDQPHNAQSLYYQYAFYGEHGRWPAWRDAIAHCADEVRAAWEEALREREAWHG